MKMDNRTRGQKNKDRHKRQVEHNKMYYPKYFECDMCGQKTAKWCEGCRMMTCYNCSEWGTCLCS